MFRKIGTLNLTGITNQLWTQKCKNDMIEENFPHRRKTNERYNKSNSNKKEGKTNINGKNKLQNCVWIITRKNYYFVNRDMYMKCFSKNKGEEKTTRKEIYVQTFIINASLLNIHTQRHTHTQDRPHNFL